MLLYKRPIKSVTVEFEDGETVKLQEFDVGFIRKDDNRLQHKTKTLEEYWQWEIRLTKKKVDNGGPLP